MQMTRRHGLVFASACALLACDAGSATQESPQAAAPSPPAYAEPQSIGASLCAPGELVVLSCVITEAKHLSLCASADVTRTSGYLYYAFGAPSQKELVFPAVKNPPDKYFKGTHLFFAGNTGGYAFSFVNSDTKYVVFTISGTGGLERQGLIATSAVSGDTLASMDCDPDSVIEDDSDVILSLIRDLEPDEDLEKHGLPSTD